MDGSYLPYSWTSDRPVGHVEFRQRCSADFHQLHISKTCILRIRSGSKTVQTDAGVETKVRRGEFVYLQRGENLTIGNTIGETGLYSSEGLVIDDRVISDFVRLHPNPAAGRNQRKGTLSKGLNDAFSRAVASVADPLISDTILVHQTHELLLWLQLQGVAHHPHRRERPEERLRYLFERDLGHKWRAPEAAQMLGMSEATLRRALSKEGTSFTELLREARLSFALMCIQTTHQSLAEIAFECGFSSQSRLTEAFKARFNITPGKLRASNTPGARKA